MRAGGSESHDPPEGPGPSAQPGDSRPRQAIEHAQAWVRGEVTMMQARAAGGHAMGAARDLRGAARHAAYAAGQAGAVAHVAAHELGAAAYISGAAVTSLLRREARHLPVTSVRVTGLAHLVRSTEP